ncbi:MAG TPA: hypothetical protein VG894_00720 [Bauldia sp.]|nr:hypothetical protein [Bauldia sp.]
MGKYAPIRLFLERRGSETVPMTFAEIEKVLGFKLPNSKNHPAWWSNNPKNNVMTNEWLAAGYKTEHVDIERSRLVFRRASATGTAKRRVVTDEKARKSDRHPIFGALKDVTWIAPGTDLTEPADPEWADLIDDPDWGKLPG